MSLATNQSLAQAPDQALGSPAGTSAPSDTAAVLEGLSIIEVGYRRDRPPVRDYWAYLPIKLRNTAPTPLHLGVYLLFARHWGRTYTAVHITDQAICSFTGFAWNKANRGKVHRAKQWLIKKGWLYRDRSSGSCRRPHYIPTWGTDTTGKPLPWTYRPQERDGAKTRHALCQPRGRGYEAIKVPVELLDDLIGVIDIDTGVVERYWTVPLIDLVELGRYVRQIATPTLTNLGIITGEGTYLPIPSREVLLQKALRGELTHVLGTTHTPVKLSNSGLCSLRQYFPSLQSEPQFVVASPLFTSEDQDRYKALVLSRVAELERDTHTAGRADLTVQMVDVATVTVPDQASAAQTEIDPLPDLLIDPLIGGLIDSMIGSTPVEGSDDRAVVNEPFRPVERDKCSVLAETESGTWNMDSHEPDQSHESDPSMDSGAEAPKRKRREGHGVFGKKNQGPDYQEAYDLLTKTGVTILAAKIARATSLDIIKQCIAEAERQQASGYKIDNFGAWVASLIQDTQAIGFNAACARRQPRPPAATPAGAAYSPKAFDIQQYGPGGKHADFFGPREEVEVPPRMPSEDGAENTGENRCLPGIISAADLTTELRSLLQQAAPVASLAGDLWIDPEAWAETQGIRLCCSSAAVYREARKHQLLIRSCVQSLPGMPGDMFLEWGFARDLEPDISAAELWDRVSTLAQEMVVGADGDVIRHAQLVTIQAGVVHIGVSTISARSRVEDHLMHVFRNAFAELGLSVSLRIVMIGGSR